LLTPRLYIWIFLNSDEVGRLAPIAMVMLPDALAFAAVAQHLNGKRGAHF